jgi:two-component system, OmpR family, sensor histidine kinase SenX3
MRITSRRKAMAFFIVLGICLVALAIALNVGWIILNLRQGILLFLGIIFFAAIILGMILNTGFLVRELRRNEQHDSFINAVTHELKTPIASIRLYLETLQRRDVDEAQRQNFYKLMLGDTDRLLGTVEQVLKAGEVSHKSGKRIHAEVDLGNIAQECMDLARMRHHLPAEALHYRESLNGTAFGKGNKSGNGSEGVNGSRPIVNGDAEGLRTAISNVLDNAIKYSGKDVDVTVEVGIPNQENVQLRVTDRGVGIPADELKRIFKRFYRVPGRAQSQVKGTGLGLFIVRSIAKAHGGKVFAESGGEARGTTITIELPRSAV